jgi:hypothetical protein
LVQVLFLLFLHERFLLHVRPICNKETTLKCYVAEVISDTTKRCISNRVEHPLCHWAK